MNTQWHAIRDNLQNSLQSGIFKVWIAPLEGSVTGLTLCLRAPNAFVADWVRERLSSAILRAAREVLGADAQLEVALAPTPPASRPIRAEKPRHTPSTQQEHEIRPTEQMPLPVSMVPRQASRNWRYSFEGFVVGPCNELAHAAARNMSKASGAVDTLFLSSSAGLGKTHLSQAVGQAVCDSANRSIKVEYLTAEEFAGCFVQAMKAREVERFKARFREADLLLLEDVHFLQGKEKMQEEVLSTIKTLQAKGSRVVLTSSFAPRELRDLDNQLVSRFCSGFLAGIERPNAATRRQILCEKAGQQAVNLSEPVADMLAQSLTSDIRQLESCLCNLILKAKLLGKDISVAMASEVIAQYTGEQGLPDVEAIISKVCEGFGISLLQICSRSRRQDYVIARNTAFYLARKHTDLSLQEIGERFGRRHSTVIKGIAAVEREMGRESPLGRQVASTVARIEQQAGPRTH